MAKIKIFALGGLNEIGKNMYVIDIDNNIFVNSLNKKLII